tara:strand:- start:315 stop:776 length:462 start_codon:yes stop_codon:yes gene_type:complete
MKGSIVMGNLNRVFLMGNMTREPELKQLPEKDTAVVNFGLAMNRTWLSEDGEQKSEVCFVEVGMFGKRAETIFAYFSKGSPIFIEGRLQLNQWISPEGQKRSMLRVVATDFQFVGRKKEEETADEPTNVVDTEKTLDDTAELPTTAKEVALTQ